MSGLWRNALAGYYGGYNKLSISRDSIWTWQFEVVRILLRSSWRGGHVFSTEKITDSFGRTTQDFSIHDSMRKASTEMKIRLLILMK